MTDRTPISGFAEPPFEKVRDVFAQNFADDLELGASFCVFVDGAPAVDLVGGYADRAREKLWSEETIAAVYSSGKAVLALLAAEAASKRLIEYDAPVADYWPEFAGAGKETITIADVMSHQAGLPGLSEEMPPADWLDWEKICNRIETQAPLWPPRTASGYSPQLFGFIVGEVLRRVTGRSVHDLVSELSAGSGDVSLYCGLGESEMARTVYIRKPPAAPDLGTLNEYTQIAFLKPWSAPARIRHEDWMAAEIPASNMHANAAALAGALYPLANRGKRADGAQMISSSVLEEVFMERIRGDDLVLPFHLSWAAGLMRNSNGHFGPNPSAFGHAGFGGSCVMIDPENAMSAAYVMNRQSPHLAGDPRAVRLLEAVYETL